MQLVSGIRKETASEAENNRSQLEIQKYLDVALGWMHRVPFSESEELMMKGSRSPQLKVWQFVMVV